MILFLKFQLTLQPHEKIILKRFLENELMQPDFLIKKDYKHL